MIDNGPTTGLIIRFKPMEANKGEDNPKGNPQRTEIGTGWTKGPSAHAQHLLVMENPQIQTIAINLSEMKNNRLVVTDDIHIRTRRQILTYTKNLTHVLIMEEVQIGTRGRKLR